MLVDAIVLCSIGLVVTVLSATRGYSSSNARWTGFAGVEIPEDQLPALQARARRRALGVGLGILVGGLVLLAVALLWPEGREEPTGAYVVLTLLAVSAAAGLALVEILWPGEAAEGPRWARSTAPTLDDYVPRRTRITSWVLVVLDAPQPARNEHELYWQDALRAKTLNTLTAMPAVVSMVALIVSGAALDKAASTAAEAGGQLGPAWTQWLLVGGYLLPVVLLVVVGLLALADGAGGVDAAHFRRRLWPAGRPVDTGAGER